VKLFVLLWCDGMHSMFLVQTVSLQSRKAAFVFFSLIHVNVVHELVAS